MRPVFPNGIHAWTCAAWLALAACSTPAVTGTADDATAAADGTVDASDDTTADVPVGPPSPVHVIWHTDRGTFDILRDQTPVLVEATADITWRDAAGTHVRSLRDPCTRTQLDPATLTCAADGLLLTLHLETPPGGTHLRARLDVQNTGAAAITVDKLTPVLVDHAAGGTLALGSDPRDVRILENGRLIVLDPAVMLVHGDAERPGLADMLPLGVRGASISNWNHIVADPAHPQRNVVAGWLTFDRCVPTLGIGMDPGAVAGPDGVRPFGVYAAENRYIWDGKPLAAGQSVASEVLWLEPMADDPLVALERYADAVAAENHVVPWAKRGPGHPIPAGWNSWSGGGGTGGHGQDIDEALILQSLEIYRREFGSFGTNYFQVDDGWQEKHGDWTFRTDTFPHGGAWLAAQIAAAGFLPGLWFAPFLVDGDSKLAAAHPDWRQPKIDAAPAFLAKDMETLDTSHPDVRTWMHALGTELTGQGWKWLKVDFSYWSLLGKHLHDPSQTHVEAWRDTWLALRDGMAADTFVCGIGALGLNVGRVEAMRLTSDNGPAWDEGEPDDMLGVFRAFLPTVRAGARRWFTQNRLWQNHDDLIFFRSWPDPKKTPVTFREARAFATFIGLMSSIVKIGDTLVEMEKHPDWIDVVRRLTPVWPEGARPVDVLVRDEPEMFVQDIDAPAGKWRNVGVCNWGKNRDHSTAEPTDLPDNTTRDFALTCPGNQPCAAYAFWGETSLGDHAAGETFHVTVQPHDCEVIALRPIEAHPQLLGDNRHITQGAADLGPVTWDAGKGVLATKILHAAVGGPTTPFLYHLAFRVPQGWTCAGAAVDGQDVPALSVQGGVADLAFVVPEALRGYGVTVRVFCQAGK